MTPQSKRNVRITNCSEAIELVLVKVTTKKTALLLDGTFSVFSISSRCSDKPVKKRYRVVKKAPIA